MFPCQHRVLNKMSSMKKLIADIIIISVFWSFLPVIATTCMTVFISRKLWLKLLRNRYPYLEFAKTNNIRSLVDTSRNPGVFHILLKVEGNCEFSVIKETLRLHVVDRVDNLGRLIFPRLKLALISCWGNYAWIKNFEDFDINNHILLGQTTFKGRPITENNIQDYVSEIVSKYMPQDLPPWQIVVIPVMPTFSSATEDDFCHNFPASYYILTRMHHLIVEEEKNLLISDVLMLNTTQTYAPVVIHEQHRNHKQSLSPFLNLFAKPSHIPKLIASCSATLSNRWNEFIYHYDPLENVSSPDVDKKCVKSILQLLAIVLIIFVSVVSDICRAHKNDKDNSSLQSTKETSLIGVWYLLLKREMEKRKLSWNIVLHAILNSLDPVKIVRDTVMFVGWCTIKWPTAIYLELQALICLVFLGKKPKSNTCVGVCRKYVPLITESMKELFMIVLIVVQTPRQIYEELMGSDNKGKNQNHQHSLQNLTLCGRKVVSWTEKIEKSALLDKMINTKASEIEILLATTSGAMRSFYQSFSGEDGGIPESINISARCLLEEYLFGKMKYREGAGGLVGMKFPIITPSHLTLKTVHENLKEARDKQIGLYLLTFSQTHFDFLTNCFPAFWMRIVINYLSRRYAVAITEVVNSAQGNESSEQKTTLWGHVVTDAIYFRTPQSNISLSLTIQRFGNHVRLGVMADAQISPHHNRISNAWVRQFEEI